MNVDQRALIWISIYIAAFIAATGGLLLWKIRRRGGRTPVDFKLLRGPGESLRRRLAKFDEDFFGKMVLVALIPIGAASLLASQTSKLGLKSWTHLWLWLGLIALVFVAAIIPAVRWTIKALTRYRADRLGYLGERHVAEQLVPLYRKGYAVFHDVPSDGTATDFNVDHVAVGPSGVAAIETKTRRKGRRRDGGSEYKVWSDGEKLRWPWGVETAGLKQALAQAEWLEKFIFQRTGINTPVKAILAIPGWWVEETGRKAVAVVNAKNLVGAVEGRGGVVLTPQQIDLIARQLDERCRDVED